MKPRIRLSALATIALCAVPFSSMSQYHLERITGILNQPTYVTQAPGDPANILYYTTRSTSANSGFVGNTMGKVWRYNTTTRTATAVLDLVSRSFNGDEGLECIAFHPDFNTPLSIGYGKLYVSSAHQNTPALNRLEEYVLLNANGSFKTTNEVAATARNILRYSNNTQNNHTVDWIGFDPTATGDARQYLYISTGDGSFGNNYNNGTNTIGRPSQNPTDLKGKILRVDISGPDFYPSDTNKNFDIPPSNPIPVYNAAHPGSPITGLGEVFVTGMRNGYRLSFDRANGDLYWGDVGEFTYEEVSFLKAGSNSNGPPADFGWPQFEGMHNSDVSGAPHTGVNPFTGAPCIFPLREHNFMNAEAAIGGYVYRGPIPELQGKYFYADFVYGRIWMLDFDRNTSPASFNGSNGTLTEMTAIWATNICDLKDTNYFGDIGTNSQRGIDHLVSFGEDNAGNMYIVDFGFGAGFNGQYTANAGEIFKLVPGPLPPRLNYSRNGSDLQFLWTGPFKLQYQTNVPGQAIGTNWVDYTNGNVSPVNATVDNTQGGVLFRLIWPP